MFTTNTIDDRKEHRIEIHLKPSEAQILAYALRIFYDVMRDAGDTKALDYAHKMDALRRTIIDAL
jgi:hypothetical protein